MFLKYLYSKRGTAHSNIAFLETCAYHVGILLSYSQDKSTNSYQRNAKLENTQKKFHRAKYKYSFYLKKTSAL